MTSEEFQKWIRILFYTLGGNVMGSAWTNGSSGQLVLSSILIGATFIWSIWGNRIAAKVAELRKIAEDPATPIKGIVLTNTPAGRAIVAESPPDAPIEVAGSPGALDIAKGA